MTILFRPVAMNFGALVAGGSGTIVQATYTVPAGKRSILIHTGTGIRANANAANTTFAVVDCNPSASAAFIVANRLHGSGLAFELWQVLMHNIPLVAGDTVRILSVNTGAAGVVISGQIILYEYL